MPRLFLGENASPEDAETDLETFVSSDKRIGGGGWMGEHLQWGGKGCVVSVSVREGSYVNSHD